MTKKHILLSTASLENWLKTKHSPTFQKALSTVLTLSSQQWNGNSHNKAIEPFDSFKPTSVLQR